MRSEACRVSRKRGVIHFNYAPESLFYAKNRYVKEAERRYGVLNNHLAKSKFLSDDDYTIADMALFGWANSAGFVMGEKGLTDYPHLKKFVETVAARPATQRALKLREKHQFRGEFDAEARHAMFPQNEIQAA